MAPPGSPKMSVAPESSRERINACAPVISVGGTTLGWLTFAEGVLPAVADVAAGADASVAFAMVTPINR